MDVKRWLDGFHYLEKVLDDHLQAPVEAIRKELAASAATSEAKGRAVRAAAIARRHFGLNEEEPVNNLCGLLETHGIKVRCQAIDSACFSGLSVQTRDHGPAISINTRRDVPVERWILATARELGHLILHPRDYDLSSEEEDEQHEQEAHAFASHFLMPESAFCRHWDEAQGLILVERVMNLKSRFRISYRTVLHRLAPRYRGNFWQYFQDEYRQLTGHTLTWHGEPDALAGNDFLAGMEPHGLLPVDFMPARLARLVRKAIDAEEITFGRSAEMLEMSLHQFRALTVSWPRFVDNAPTGPRKRHRPQPSSQSKSEAA